MRFFALIAAMTVVFGGIAVPVAAQETTTNATEKPTSTGVSADDIVAAAEDRLNGTATPSPTPTRTTTVQTSTTTASTSTATRTTSTPTPNGSATITATATPQPTARPTGQNNSRKQNLTQISENVRLVDSGYNSEEGTAWVKLRAVENSEVVTISDAGALSEGSGTIDTERIALHPGETVQTSVSVTQVDGLVGVVIATESGDLYGELIEPQNQSPFEKTGPTEGWLGGTSSIAAMTVLAAYRELNKNSKAPERAS